MAADLVPEARSIAYESWKSLSHPAQEKERTPDVMRSKDVEQAFSVSLHTSRQLIPLLSSYYSVHRFGLEIILNVHGDAV